MDSLHQQPQSPGIPNGIREILPAGQSQSLNKRQKTGPLKHLVEIWHAVNVIYHHFLGFQLWCRTVSGQTVFRF